jgi:predicted MPP superfamily phosphohydrolase
MLEHIRVAHLTDQHVGRVTPYSIQREAVALANQQKPDLVVITGDFVCHSQVYLDQLSELMRTFEAPVMAVLGNHDHWAGGGEVLGALRRGGVEVLSNHHTTITIRNQALQVVGLDDAYTGHANREAAVKGLRKDVPTLALSHIAEEADGLWRHGIPLVLSGHTHGGQVTVARLHEISVGKIAGHKYIHGLYGSRAAGPSNGNGAQQPAGAVYVGAGIGAALMPLRLGARGKREVTIFELGYQPGAFAEPLQEQPALRGRKPSAALVQRRAEQVVVKRQRRSRRRTIRFDI